MVEGRVVAGVGVVGGPGGQPVTVDMDAPVLVAPVCGLVVTVAVADATPGKPHPPRLCRFPPSSLGPPSPLGT